MKNNGKAKFVCESAVIAALYVALTYISSLLGLSSNAIQVRFSEALCILPAFTPAAIPGLAIGCLISNMLTGSILIDVFFGSLATLIGAIGTYLLRKHRIPALLPPIVSNTLIIPPVLKFAYLLGDSYLLITAGVFAGEFISVGVLGFLLWGALKSRKLERLL